jgi:hypothetical protein
MVSTVRARRGEKKGGRVNDVDDTEDQPEYVLSALALIDAFARWPDPEVAIPGEETAGRMLARLDYGKLRERVLGKFLLHLGMTLGNPGSNRMDAVAKFVEECEIERSAADVIIEDLLGRIGDD